MRYGPTYVISKHKLEFRSKQCVFVGYSSLHKGYKCLDVATGRVYVSQDVVFDEYLFPFLPFAPQRRSPVTCGTNPSSTLSH